MADIRSETSPFDVFPISGEGKEQINVGEPERKASRIGGGLLALYGVTRFSMGGLALAALGGVLYYRGKTGHCPAYEAMGINTAATFQKLQSVRISEAVTVNRPCEEVYAFWRDLENLPRFMEHISSVEGLDQTRSRWNAPVPGGLGTVTWIARISEERPPEYLAWRSEPDADIQNDGSVFFRDLGEGRGTEVHATIEYRPPAGKPGALAAKLLNPIFSRLIKEDIRRFKSLVETGEIPTTHEQPVGP